MVKSGPLAVNLFCMALQRSPRHLLTLQDLTNQELEELIELSIQVKGAGAQPILTGRTAGLLFFRGSLRTRASFEVAVHQLGGHSINLNASSDFWELEARAGSIMDGRAPEHIKDAATILSRYVDALAIRPKPEGQSWAVDRRDESIRAWAQTAEVPVINMESALHHPLQALADMMTMRETLGSLRGKRLAVVWTHSPVPSSTAVVHSLLMAAARLGMEISISHPPGFHLDGEVVGRAQAVSEEQGTELRCVDAPDEAAEGAHIIYARSWRSLEYYGNATLEASHRARTTDRIVDAKLLARGADARFMHAMPVRRNTEVTDEVLDGECSLAYEQGANRLHSLKALLIKLLGNS